MMIFARVHKGGKKDPVGALSSKDSSLGTSCLLQLFDIPLEVLEIPVSQAFMAGAKRRANAGLSDDLPQGVLCLLICGACQVAPKSAGECILHESSLEYTYYLVFCEGSLASCETE